MEHTFGVFFFFGIDFLFAAADFFEGGGFLAGDFLCGAGFCTLAGLGEAGMVILGADCEADADFSLPHWLRLYNNTSGIWGSTPPCDIVTPLSNCNVTVNSWNIFTQRYHTQWL